jgi:hypothetical protein
MRNLLRPLCWLLHVLAEACSTVRIVFYAAYVGLDYLRLKLEERIG